MASSAEGGDGGGWCGDKEKAVARFSKITSAVTGGLVILDGVLELISVFGGNIFKVEEDFRNFVLSICLILFGFMALSVIIPWNWLIRLRHRNFGFMSTRIGKGCFFFFLGCLCLHNSLADVETYIGLTAIAAGVLQFLLICMVRELPYDQALLNDDDATASDNSGYDAGYDPSLNAAYQNIEDAVVDKVASKVVEKAEERVRSAVSGGGGGDADDSRVAYSDF
eukprot:g2420.t1